jgi:pilus assembly protein CpaF
LQLPNEARERLFREVINELLGYGPIQPLLDDPGISEVMVNGHKQVYIERDGKVVRTDITFENNEQVLRLIHRITAQLGRRIDEDHPMVDARLLDGSQIIAIIPPVAIDGPAVTIRKFGKEHPNIDQLIKFGSLTQSLAEFLHACVVARLNIVISGGTSSGKTTLLNALSSFIPEEERIITIEDTAELRLPLDHTIRLEAKSSKAGGSGAVTLRDLIRNSLQMRPERIVIGEVRGGEALDMLQAMNTGHDGMLTTLQADHPRDAISRLETFILTAGLDLPAHVLRKQIASAVDVIIQQTRLRDGSRKITQITEVAGLEGDTVVLSDIFKFDQTGLDPDEGILGELKPTGIRPLFSNRLEAAGFKLKPEVFGANVAEILAHGRHPSRNK